MSFSDNLRPDDEPMELRSIARFTDLLDTKFKIPGTNIRFGADFLLGLLPGVGDAAGFLFSGMLVTTMARYGASGSVILKMLFNVFLDSTIGAIPLVGDLFDLGFKANLRNYRLLREHYAYGEHSGSGKGILVGVLIALVLIFILLIWVVFNAIQFLWHLIVG